MHPYLKHLRRLHTILSVMLLSPVGACIRPSSSGFSYSPIVSETAGSACLCPPSSMSAILTSVSLFVYRMCVLSSSSMFTILTYPFLSLSIGSACSCPSSHALTLIRPLFVCSRKCVLSFSLIHDCHIQMTLLLLISRMCVLSSPSLVITILKPPCLCLSFEGAWIYPPYMLTLLRTPFVFLSIVGLCFLPHSFTFAIFRSSVVFGNLACVFIHPASSMVFVLRPPFILLSVGSVYFCLPSMSTILRPLFVSLSLASKYFVLPPCCTYSDLHFFPCL